MTKTATRCPAADEDTPCGAEWAILPQVNSDRLSDILRKRKVVVITSLATHREHTGPPIDIIEFQSDDFARSQPQAGQEEKDCVIATSNRCAAIARPDNPFDLIRLQMFGHASEPPGSHGRNVPARSRSVSPCRKRNRKKERSAVTISLATPGLLERACRSKKPEMSSGASSRR